MLGVGAYFLFNAGLYFWGYFIEGNTVYVGSKNGITVSSDPLVPLFLPIPPRLPPIPSCPCPVL